MACRQENAWACAGSPNRFAPCLCRRLELGVCLLVRPVPKQNSRSWSIPCHQRLAARQGPLQFWPRSKAPATEVEAPIWRVPHHRGCIDRQSGCDLILHCTLGERSRVPFLLQLAKDHFKIFIASHFNFTYFLKLLSAFDV